VNHHLQKRNKSISNLTTDLQDGIILINLLEILSGVSIHRYVKNPRFAAQKLSNITEAFQFMENHYHLKLIGCNASGICFESFHLFHLLTFRMVFLRRYYGWKEKSMYGSYFPFD